MATRNTLKPQTLRNMQIELATLKRRHGATFRDIARCVGVSKSTAHRWTQDVAFDMPPIRSEMNLVPLADGGFTWQFVTTQPPTPARDRRGRRRTSPHIEDTQSIRMLEMDIRQRLRLA